MGVINWDNQKAWDLVEKMAKNESVSRWDVYYNRKVIRSIIDENSKLFGSEVGDTLEDYIESVLETV